MKVRCFGGPFDGRRREVAPDLLHHAQVVEIDYHAPLSTAKAYTVRVDISTTTPIIRTLYRVMSMHINNGTWYCLVHGSMTDEQLMDRLFL